MNKYLVSAVMIATYLLCVSAISDGDAVEVIAINTSFMMTLMVGSILRGR